ncbi:MAG: LysR family transcriptional regulator [Myxococcota bacterium]|nr:LysR family transcriptional regulator [Myxococcota bacterium]
MTPRVDLFAGVLPFVRTAEQRSFSRAAAELGVTTAAVSKAVKKLEEDLGVKLLDRSSRVVALTRAGEVFLERCRQAVLSVQGAREVMQTASREPQGELAVTMPFILAPFVVPNLQQLAAQYPRLWFRLSMSDRLARLADERFDVAIRVGELQSSTLVSRLLRGTRWVTVAAPAYLARHPAPRTAADLADHNALRFLAPDGKPRTWVFREGGKEKTVRTGGNLLVDHGTSLLGATEAGMGVGQLLDFMVEEPIRQGRLVELLPGLSAPGPKIHALTTQGRAKSTNVVAFMRFLLQTFEG